VRPSSAAPPKHADGGALMAGPAPAEGPESLTKPGFFASIAAYFEPRPLLMLALGFSSGLPFLLVFGTLSVWLRESGVSRTEIGLLFYVGLAYTIKFLWAPLLDHFRLPVLGRLLGRRRAWMILAQAFVALGLIGISTTDPGTSVMHVAFFAVIVAFASATQDIAIDAWRIESVPGSKQGVMAGAYQLGYRFALIASGAGALYIADFVSWHAAYLAMAALMGVGVVAALLAPAPKEAGAEHVKGEDTVTHAAEQLGLKGPLAKSAAFLYRTAVAPFVDFFARQGWIALVILALIGAYRLPDFVMGVMANPLYVDLGFSKTEIASVAKLYGVWLSIAGMLTAGTVIVRIGLLRTLLIGEIGIMLANLTFAWLSGQGHDIWALTAAISAENFAAGFAGTALIAYMSSLTNVAFTATQYALFSSFYALPGKLVGGSTGFIVDKVGYETFYIGTSVLAIPALLLILLVMKLNAAKTLTAGQPSPSS